MPSELNLSNSTALPSNGETGQDGNSMGSQSDNNKTKLEAVMQSPTTEEQLSNQSTQISRSTNQPSLSQRLGVEDENASDQKLCIAKGDTGDKKSDITTHFWGIKREIECTYVCTDANTPSTEVRGTHTEKNYLQYYRESDDGREGQCLGAVYGEPVFNPNTLRESYSRTHFEHFSPESSGSKELEDWAEKN